MGRVDLPVLAGYKAQPKLRGGLFGLGILSCYAQEVRRGNLPIACCRATHAGKSRSPSHSPPPCKDLGTRKKQKRSLPYTRASVPGHRGPQPRTDQNRVVPADPGYPLSGKSQKLIVVD